MALPRKLKGFTLYANGDDCFGEIKEVTLPKVTRKIEDYQPGGFDSPVGIDLGGDALDMEVNFGGYMAEQVELMGETLSGVQLRFQGALQREDSEVYDELRVVARGRYTEEDSGSAKQGDDTEHKFKYRLTYYKIELNGKTVVEIDILQQKFITGGKDRLAGLKKALGRA